MFLTSAVAGMFGGGAAGATAATGAATAASSGLSLSSILQGVATVGGVVASIAAGNAEAESLQAQARDAEQEKTLETVQSAERKRGLLKQAQEALGEMDTAYAASGVDLSFGTAGEARKSTYRELDIALNSDSATTSSRLSRLDQRASNLYRMAKRARGMGWLSGLTRGAGGFASIAEQN